MKKYKRYKFRDPRDSYFYMGVAAGAFSVLVTFDLLLGPSVGAERLEPEDPRKTVVEVYDGTPRDMKIWSPINKRRP